MKKLLYFLFVFLYFFHVNAFAAGILAYTNLSDSPDPAWVGDNITYTVSLTNQYSGCLLFGCTDNISSVQTTSAIPSGMTWVSGSGCTVSGSTITCSFGTLYEGTTQSKTFTLKAPSTAGTVTLNTTATGNLGIHYLLAGSTTSASQTTTMQAPTLSIANASLVEGNTTTSNMNFTVTLSRSMNVPVTVNYATANGTATAGEDYTNTSGTLTFAAGTTSKTISVPIIGDTNVENNETFTVTLSNPSYATITTATATGTIINDDTMTPTINYRMDECTWNGTSGEVKDTNGSDYNATAKGTSIPQLSTQIINNGALFTRANQQYIQLPTLQQNKPNFNDGFSITTWAKFSSTAANWERIFDFGNGTDSDNIILARNGSSTTLTFAIHGSTSGDTYLNATNAITDTNWHFWAVTCTGATCKLYKDGTLIASSSTMRIPANIARTQSFIGKSNWSWDDYFEGGIDEFKVFDSVLSDTHITAIYTDELAKKNYDGTARNSVSCGYCSTNNLSNGFQIVNPYSDINKSIEIYCYNNKDYLALPIKNDSNNFVFNNNILGSTNYYNEAKNNATHFDAIEINAYTLEVQTSSAQRLPLTISAPTTFQTMGSSFSNINLTGTPFAIDWNQTVISNCTQAKLRNAYYGQDVKINTLNYDAKAICHIDKMKLKLLDDYRYLEYEGNEVLEKSCKVMAEAVPTSFLASSSIKGHYWISPFNRARTYNATNIKSNERPIVAYCWYQTDLDWVWTFSLAMDGKVTNTKNDLVNKADTCSEFGLVPFVANKEDTFERVRSFLEEKKPQWVNYTGTINEKIQLFMGGSYYLGTEQNSIIWPYGSFGVYHPNSGGGWAYTGGNMSGSPMHNIQTITTDYARINNDEGVLTRDYYSHGHYSNTETIVTANQYAYKDTMGAKGWVSVLGSADLNKTNEWFISRTGAGDNFDSTGSYPYYEPNGNYTGGAWLNFLFDSNGRVRHNDDWDANYPYYDYMCMSEDNYDFTTRYGLLVGPFKAIEHSVSSGTEAANTQIQTKIVNENLRLDIILLNDGLTALYPDRNVSVGIFMNDTYVSSGVESARDIHYFGDIKLNGTGTFNALKTTGRFEIPAANWPSALQRWTRAKKRLFIKFKYCSLDNQEWTSCWTRSGNTATCISGKESYCKSVDSDDFAVRPKNFDFSITGSTPYKAGRPYDIVFSAKDDANVSALDFNESVPFVYNETKTGCLTGDYNGSVTAIPMQNGTKTLNLMYDEVGRINVKLQETLGSEFALVDADDTPNLARLITPFDQNISYTPNHFSLTGTTLANVNDANFTYVATDLNMSAKLDINISARGFDGNITQNYNKNCYAKETDYNISYTTLTLEPANALSRINYLETNTSTIGFSPINTNLTLNDMNASIFGTDANGTATLNLAINFDRNISIPHNPFRFTIHDVNISDTDTIGGSLTLDQNTTFYYGRVHAPDQRFSGTSGTANIYYEVYCRNCTSAFRTSMGITGNESVDAVSWYQNNLHVNNTFGEFNSTAVSAASSGLSLGSRTLTTQALTATSTPHVNRINFGSSSWLRHYPEYFKVEFIGSGTWAGEGSVDRNQTSGKVGGFAHENNVTRAHRRMNW